LEITDLRVFMAVAEEGNITRAARRMEYVQSNITARIRKLEEELGVPLFDRHPKGVTLTPRGVVLRGYAEGILQLVEEAIRETTDREEPHGMLSIGVVETVASTKFMEILANFQARYPGVSLSLQSGTSPELLSKVSEGKLDGAFVSLEVDGRKWITEYQIHDEVSLYYSGDVPNMASATWIMFSQGCPYRLAAEHWLLSLETKPRNVIEVNTLETMINAISMGLGIALLPHSVVSIHNERIKRQSIPETYANMVTSLVRRRDKYCSSSFAAFVEEIKGYDL
jgi:DNA-binding transcriptional LysR family regulator